MAFSTFLFYEKSIILAVEIWTESRLYSKRKGGSSDSEILH